MDDKEHNQREERRSRDTGEKHIGSRPQFNHHDSGSGHTRQQKKYLGCLTKQQLIMVSVAVGLLVLLIIITVPAVVLTRKSAPPLFPTDGDMLDYLVQIGEISEPDGLLATWFHRANNKEEMNKALQSDAMILEADVNLHGKGTPNEKPIPIMAHPPDIYSDNTLDEWLDAVLASTKGVKLDFKSLESVGFSLDVLSQKHSIKSLNRSVWLNADVLLGPNTPSFVPLVNGTRFLQLIQEKFPDVTLSPGWMVLYLPPFSVKTYSRSMMEDMYELIKNVPQKVTFPIHALLAREAWQHISWLLSQSQSFSLTLWQGSIHPNVSDLLFIRDNTHPSTVYYDIYEPTLSEFKEAAKQQGRVRRFYPGGDLMDFLHPVHNPNKPHNSQAVHWFAVTDRTSLLTQLSDGSGGMLVVRVASDPKQPGVPLVEDFGKGLEAFTLQDVLLLLAQRPEVPWGVYLQIHSQNILEASLELLQSAYGNDELYRPVWIRMDGSQITEGTKEFISTVETLFPYVTLVLTQQTWPPLIPASVTGLSQRLALHLNTASLPKEWEVFESLVGMMDRYDLIVQEDTEESAAATSVLKQLAGQRRGMANTHLYVLSGQS